jgi:hypothetical protein
MSRPRAEDPLAGFDADGNSGGPIETEFGVFVKPGYLAKPQRPVCP